MKKVGLVLLALLALLFGARPAAAASFEWGGTVQGRIGYGTNPYLDTRSDDGTGLVGFTIAPTLRWREQTAVTELSGSYSRDQYFSRYGSADNYNVDLTRTQQITTRLSGTARVGYFSSISGLISPYYGSVASPAGVVTAPVASPVVTNPVVITPGVIIDPGIADQLTYGTRQQRIYGSAGLNWQPNARDTVYGSAQVERDTFSRFGGDYTYLGGTVGYLRAIDAKTRVGFDLTAAHTFSRDFPDTSSVQPNVTLQRQLSAHWTFNGGIGAIIARERIAGRSRTKVSPGFNASLCGEYPRLSICATAARATAASGLGGLRRQTQFGATATYKLTEHSRVLAAASYGISDADRRIVIGGVAYGTQRFTLARADYQRDLSRRLTAGVTGSYQQRSGGGLPTVHALAITFNLTAKFGHLS